MEIFKDIRAPHEPVTDTDFEKMFTKIAADNNCTTGSELQTIVNDTYNGKYNLEFDKWAEKLTLDRTRLLDVFKKK